MGRTREVELIKSYLPIRIRVADEFSTFIYVKEQQAYKNGTNNTSNTMFVCNALSLRGLIMQRDLHAISNATNLHSFDRYVLKEILNKFGKVENVVTASAPAVVEESHNKYLNESSINIFADSFDYSTRLPFAHVIFSSNKQMKKAIKRIGEGQGINLSRLEINEMIDQFQLESKKNENADKGDDGDNDAQEPLMGIDAVIMKYKSQIPSREELSEMCDEVMAKFDAEEESEKQEMLAKTNVPDEHGFITVTKDSNIFVGSRRKRGKEDEEEAKNNFVIESAGFQGGGRKASKRARKRRDNRGNSNLKDFYRFQTREYKQNEVLHLRQRFEEDLQTVKRMKEEKKFKPI
mmetsp:Transcript_4886/g.6611  ORF Transcript_4886/g.6611 Transcript_4886/m.6611 type:complete len:349 (+) Transcript_4886:125-1171(+)